MVNKQKNLDILLRENHPSTKVKVQPAVQLEPYTWKEIRLFLSSSFVDTHAERDALIKRVIPNLNRKLADRFIYIVPVDLRWGVLKEESKDCHAIQKTCMNQIDKCRQDIDEYPWFLGLRTDRYGWVQDKLLESAEYTNPQRYDWVKTLEDYEKQLSITSLECIHATLPPEKMRPIPNVFFYKRHIINPEDIEENLKWVFDFEFVPEEKKLDADVQNQYTKTSNAITYEEDKENLDKYLKSLEHIKYSTYRCRYEKNGAWITGDNGTKKFGVGYVSELEDFEKLVEKDLLDAIDKNFKEADISGFPAHVLENIPYESAVKEKAFTFVGRSDIFDKCYNYCAAKHYCAPREESSGLCDVLSKFCCINRCNQQTTSEPSYEETPPLADTDSSTMIVHGEPGCGKSALMATVATKCLKDLRDRGEFFFAHAVDSCPGSNNLELMLRRLQVNLQQYRINLGESEQRPKSDLTSEQVKFLVESARSLPSSMQKNVLKSLNLDESDLSEQHLKSTADLKSGHVKFLEESARKHPDKLFIILIDAVNQFHDGLQSWQMWWLPSKDAPENLRVVISTLNEENGTFENASKMCPNAVKVSVEEMSYEDGEEMVSTILARYNKKLTTTEDPFLGNQMKDLLRKNLSPLYLTATTQALRRFGIYENVRGFIKSLPDTIPALFNFVLDSWSKEYGEEFIRDVVCIICLSKDGLLENEINDVLSYIEKEKNVDYQCSFSRVYDSLSGFLAAGGGGYLRFFHDQLNKVVRNKFLTPNSTFEQEIHGWLVDFYVYHIRPQLSEHPIVEPPTYYKDCLKQVVYHQLQSTKSNEKKVDFKDTLRNIYFVRDRIAHQQYDLLLQEYVQAGRSMHENEKKVLKQWAKFAQLYSPHIKEFPEWSFNMATNQLPTSCVAMDTNNQPEPTAYDDYPLYWNNVPSADDAVVLKYNCVECWSCAASTSDRNLICVGGKQRAFLYEADSGVLLHQVEVGGEVRSVYVSTKYNSFWTGDGEGYVNVWSVETGAEEWKSKRIDAGGYVNREVIWITRVGDYIACGTRRGTIIFFDEQNRNITKSWSTELECYSYRYQGNKNQIISGHKDVVKCWSVDGELVRSVEVGGIVTSLSIHPSKEDVIAFVLGDEKYRKYCVKQMKLSTGEEICVIPDTSEYGVVLYDNSGERVLCVDGMSVDYYGERTIMVCGEDGKLQNKLKGHSDWIRNMCLVHGTNELLTAAKDGSILFYLPTKPDEDVGESTEEVIRCCEFIRSGDEFVTLTTKGKLQKWVTSSCERSTSVTSSCERSTSVTSSSEQSTSIDIEGARGAAFHPGGNDIVVYTNKYLYCFNSVNLEMVSSCYAIPEIEDDNIKILMEKYNDSMRIKDVKISRDGTKCVVTTATNFYGITVVYDITDINDFKRSTSYTMDGYMQSSDIHRDNERVVSVSGDGMDVWSLSTGKQISKLRERVISWYVKFLHESDRILYVDEDYHVRIMDMTGVDIVTFGSRVKGELPLQLVRNETQLITGETDDSIRFHDTRTGKVLYTFVNHTSEGFLSFLEFPSNEMVYAYNKNGMMYVLRNSRN